MSNSSELFKVHPTSKAGYDEGKAELYDAIRSLYQSELLAYTLKVVNGNKDLKVVEIASGSGKFTRSLLAHSEWSHNIGEMRCIEPNEGMRAVFARTINDPRVKLSNGTFDDTGVPGHWADLIIVETAFHWCMDLEAAISEFIRILKPNGVVCLLWNLEDPSGAPWVQQLYDLCLPFRDNTPSSAEGMVEWKRVFDLPIYKENFSAPEETTMFFNEPRTVENITALYMTWSGIAILPDKDKATIKEQIRAVIKRGDGVVWLDEKQDVLEAPFVTPVFISRRK